MITAEDVIKGNVEYDETDYVIKIRYENNRRVFDVFVRYDDNKIALRWIGLSENGLKDLGEMI